MIFPLIRPYGAADEALRRAEAEVADKYFPNDADAVAKYEIYTQTVQVTNELPGLPVSVLGPYSLKQKVSQETVAEFHSEGKALQTAYKTNERYETLMTAQKRSGTASKGIFQWR